MPTVENFPVRLLSQARTLIAEIHKRQTRAATRSGQIAPQAPTLATGANRSIVRCTACQARGAFTRRNARCVCDDGAYMALEVCDLEIVAERVALAGWEILAVIEPMQGGNLLRQVPGADVRDGELESYRTCAITCDHCHTSRARKETFVVRADGTAGVAIGTLRQVGRSCLADFLGGASADSVIARLDYVRELREMSEGVGGGREMYSYDPSEILAWTASVVRIDGWVPKSKADECTLATVHRVTRLVSPPSLMDGSWSRDRETYAPTADDHARADAALAWARTMSAASDYERNLQLVARQESLEHSHLGILCSALPAYERTIARQVADRTVASTSAHVGTVGARIALELTVERVHSFETQFGMSHMHVFRDANGNVIIWKTGSCRLDVGEIVRGKGTIKAHTEFRGTRQTEVSRLTCK